MSQPTNSGVSVIGFDADDTLWPTGHLYDVVLKEFVERNPRHTVDGLLAKHAKNVSVFGYGAMGLQATLLAATAESDAQPEDKANLLKYVLEACRHIHEDSATPFLGVADKLAELRSAGYRLVCITKGSLTEQLRKLGRSGLEDFFEEAFVLPRKTTLEYEQVLRWVGVPATEFLMIGDSVSGDVEPVVALGGKAILIASSKPHWEDHDTDVDSNPVPVAHSLVDIPTDLFVETTRSKPHHAGAAL